MEGFTSAQLSAELAKRKNDAGKRAADALKQLLHGARFTKVDNVMSVQYGMIVLARFDVPTGTYYGIQFHKGMGYDFALTMDQVKKGGTEAHKQLLSIIEKWDLIQEIRASL